MPYGLFRTSYFHISVATSVGAKRVPLAHSTLASYEMNTAASPCRQAYFARLYSFMAACSPSFIIITAALAARFLASSMMAFSSPWKRPST